MMKTPIALLCALCFVAGCKTYTQPESLNQTLHFQSKPAGAKVDLFGGYKILKSGVTPWKVKVRKSKGLVVRILKDGYQEYVVELEAIPTERLSWWMFPLFPVAIVKFWNRASGAEAELQPGKIDVKLLKLDRAVRTAVKPEDKPQEKSEDKPKSKAQGNKGKPSGSTANPRKK